MSETFRRKKKLSGGVSMWRVDPDVRAWVKATNRYSQERARVSSRTQQASVLRHARWLIGRSVGICVVACVALGFLEVSNVYLMPEGVVAVWSGPAASERPFFGRSA
jgi:hypothetical protein